MPTRVLLLGAAGRDFHNFNVLYRNDPAVEVVGFTATQIPNIAGRRYPAALAGERYPDGIPIFPEERLETLIGELRVDRVLFSYSDVSHEHVMHVAARAVASGAGFAIAGDEVMLAADKPVVAITATRTGAGKSQTSRKVRNALIGSGKRVAVVRHPMPYGDIASQRSQRFGSYEDLDAAQVTIEEREEYEPYIREGAVIFGGVDYEMILRAAQEEADVIIWDGGNNDLPFFRPSLHICVVDPHRAGHGIGYWPGEANLRRADVVVINKMDTATAERIAEAQQVVADVNPTAVVVHAASPIRVDTADLIAGRRVLVVEDGPTITHGGMAFGAGTVAAQRYEAAEIVDPRPHAVGSLAEVFATYPHIGPVLPAMGYSEAQQDELRGTIEAAAPDTVVIGTPIDLASILRLDIPSTRVYYDLEEIEGPTLEDLVAHL